MTEKRKKLIEKFDKWLSTDPLKSIAGIQCANIAEDYANEQLKLNDVVVPKGTLCQCGKEYLIYNDREGLNVCTLCGKSELA